MACSTAEWRKRGGSPPEAEPFLARELSNVALRVAEFFERQFSPFELRVEHLALEMVVDEARRSVRPSVPQRGVRRCRAYHVEGRRPLGVWRVIHPR